MIYLKILKYTKTHIYILTDDNNQLKLVNPGYIDKYETYKWLMIISSDYDKLIREDKYNN